MPRAKNFLRDSRCHRALRHDHICRGLNQKLAYDIQKISDGYYYLLNFEASHDLPVELERSTRFPIRFCDTTSFAKINRGAVNRHTHWAFSADPELRYAASTGRAVTNFRLAVNRPFSKRKATSFALLSGKTGRKRCEVPKTGSQCAVEGSIQIEQYQDRDGNTRYSPDIVANYVEFLGSPSRPKRCRQFLFSSAPIDEREMDFPGVDDEDIPF